MDCGFFERKLSDYLKGKLSPGISREMEEHFASCKECHALYEAERIISDTLKETSAEKAPARIEDSILRLILEDNYLNTGMEASNSSVSSFDCGEFENNAAAYTDGSLSPEIAKLMEIHSVECGACGNLLKAHRAVFASLEETVPVKAPDGFELNILKHIYAEAPVKAQSPVWVRFRPVFRVASAFVAVVSCIAAVSFTLLLLVNRINEMIFRSTGNQDVFAGINDLFGLLKASLYYKTGYYLSSAISEFGKSSSVNSSEQTFPLYLLFAAGAVAFVTWNYFSMPAISTKNRR